MVLLCCCCCCCCNRVLLLNILSGDDLDISVDSKLTDGDFFSPPDDDDDGGGGGGCSDAPPPNATAAVMRMLADEGKLPEIGVRSDDCCCCCCWNAAADENDWNDDGDDWLKMRDDDEDGVGGNCCCCCRCCCWTFVVKFDSMFTIMRCAVAVSNFCSFCSSMTSLFCHSNNAAVCTVCVDCGVCGVDAGSSVGGRCGCPVWVLPLLLCVAVDSSVSLYWNDPLANYMVLCENTLVSIFKYPYFPFTRKYDLTQRDFNL